MRRELLDYLCDPVDKSPLLLKEGRCDATGAVAEGILVSASGRRYPIRNGIPRFLPELEAQLAVASFGDEWNYFNFDEFKSNWLRHTVANTFGTPQAFKGRLIVDAGGGSGMQSRWMREYGARYVICLELSHSVDGVMRENLADIDGVDVVQCSIDRPPIRDNSIDGFVICHNVIQHTPSVEETAHALWRIVAKGGELVFNCYPRNDAGLLRAARFRFYLFIRKVLSAQSFRVRLGYARLMAALRLLPIVGVVVEKAGLMSRGDVLAGSNFIPRAFRQAVLNTVDAFGAHRYQHHKTDDEIRKLVRTLQENPNKVRNATEYFAKPPPIGCALRLQK